jgi:hypothetical protein
MREAPKRSRPRRRAASSPALLVVAAAAVLAPLAGCSSGSSTPAYCADRSSLQNSVKGLTSLNASSGLSGLNSQIDKIQSDATTVVNSAKSDFPSETSAITSSIDALKSSVKGLSSSPSAAQIATITKDAGNVVSSVKNFTDASNSKCGS